MAMRRCLYQGKGCMQLKTWFVEHVREFVRDYLEPGGFYQVRGNTYDEAKSRLMFLKDVIENKGGHRIFYLDGLSIEREADLDIPLPIYLVCNTFRYQSRG